MNYDSLFHTTSSYGIIFWRQSTNSKKLFMLQKRIIHLMMGLGDSSSHRDTIRQLGILPLKSQYIFSILLLVSKNRNLFITNYAIHNVKTRHSDNLYPPTSSLTLYQNGVNYSGIRIFNKLPAELKELVEKPKLFKSSLRRYLVSNCFYKSEQFYSMTG
jgi:hypothetical protein